MAKKLTTLYIEDNEIKLMVTAGKTVEKWASMMLDSGMVNEGVIMQEDAVAERIRSLASSHGVSGEVTAAISGLNSIFRLVNLPEVPKNILEDAVQAEGARVIPVPMDQVYLSRQELQTKTPHEMRFFLAAHPKNATDALVRTIQKAGLKIKVMDIAPLALGRSVHVPRSVVVNTWLSSIDIIILVDRVPEVIRSFSIPMDIGSDSERLMSIAEEISRTVTFYNSSHTDAPFGADVPVLVAGELARNRDAWTVLGGDEGHPVEAMTSGFTMPEGFDMTQYMVNLGIAVRLAGDGEYGSMIDLNAIPPIYLPRGVNWFNILAPVAGVLLLGALYYGWTYVQDIKTETDTIQPKIDALTVQIAQEQAKLAGLKKQVDDVNVLVPPIDKEALALRSAYESLREQREFASGIVRNAWIQKPLLTVTLESVAWDGEYLTIIGVATKSEAEVFLYATQLRNTLRFENVVVTEIIKELTEDTKVYVYKFTLTVY